ncbi:MAG: exodeoxyribonuclease VII large subunit [Actinomycetes bacterium]
MALETSAESPAAVRTVSRLLADWIGRLGGIWVDGQVAEFRRRPGARNLYLTLRDPDVDMSITVVADVSVIGAVEPPLAEGQRIIVFGKPEFWTGRGTLSLRAKEIRAVGLGDLLAQLARLRELLDAEGLFAADRKKPLPFLPRRVGLICGRNSAAMHDVLVNARERWPSIQFTVREVAVQGVQAVSAVSEALVELDALPDVDVIVIARGGGSVEDLLPFSNETLVRAVAGCATPVVSAIGHEQDAPLIDFVADLRASTPTDAAKRIVPSLAEQSALIASLRARSHRVVVGQLDRESQRVTDLRRRSRTVALNAITSRESEIGHLSARVRTLSPAATLERGYAIVMNASGVIVRTPDEADSALDIRVSGGRFTATRTDS